MILSSVSISDSILKPIAGAIFWYDPGNTASYSGEGSTLLDVSGNSRNSDIVGSPPYTPGDGGYFTMSDDYIYTPDLDQIITSNDLAHSIEVWVYPTDNGVIASYQGTNSPNTSYHFSSIELVSGQFEFGLWNGTSITSTNGTGSIELNQWYQVVLTYGGTGTPTKGYVNGSLVGQTANMNFYSPMVYGDPVFRIAFGISDITNQGDGSYFDGDIGIIRGYNFELAADDIFKNYESTKVLYRSNRGTLENPGTSAQDIFESGQTTSDWYYIQTSTMGSPRQVYCNMTDEGGGWMLIGYTPSFNNTNGGLGAGLSYPNTWQNGEGTFNRLRVDAMDLWFHDSTAQCTQVMKMATTTYDQEPLLANMDIANKVVYTNPSNLLLSTSATYPTVNDTPMTGTWSPIKGHTLMSTSLTVNAPGDWIYSANSWWTVCGPSTQLISNGRSGNAQGTGSWTNPSTNNLYGMRDVSATTNSNRTDIQTYAVYIK
jgi:hypothetical protein